MTCVEGSRPGNASEGEAAGHRFRVAFAGIAAESLPLLLSRFDVVLVNLVPELASQPTKNPAGWLFRAVYRRLAAESKGRPMTARQRRFLSLVWRGAAPATTGLFRRYREYLQLVLDNGVAVVDFDDVERANALLKEVDVLFVNNWWLLPPAIFAAPRMGSVNMHPSKLPRHRGSVPTLWALKEGDRECAVSYFVLDARIDTGRLLAQHVFPIDPEDDAVRLDEKVSRITKETLADDLHGYLTGRLVPKEQPREGGSMTPKYHAYRRIQWAKERAVDIANKVNLYPFLWPLDACFSEEGPRRMFIWAARVAADESTRSVAFAAKTAGAYAVRGLSVFVRAADGKCVSIPLFRGLGVRDSLRLLVRRRRDMRL